MLAGAHRLRGPVRMARAVGVRLLHTADGPTRPRRNGPVLPLPAASENGHRAFDQLFSTMREISDMSEPRSTSYEVTRLHVPLPGSFEDAVRHYESLVPPLDTTALQGLVGSRAPWGQFLDQAERNAPHGFMIFWRNAGTSLMSLAGENTSFVMYLMGNHTIAQRMFHHDASVMLHAPLRTEIYQGSDGPLFVIDKPSSHFNSYRHPEISRVGAELDQKVADLLDRMGAPVPAGLR